MSSVVRTAAEIWPSSGPNETKQWICRQRECTRLAEGIRGARETPSQTGAFTTAYEYAVRARILLDTWVETISRRAFRCSSYRASDGTGPLARSRL